MVSSTDLITNPAIRLSKYIEAVRKLSPETYERVKESYKKYNGHGYKLAFIPAKQREQQIRDFPWKTQAEDRVVNFEGLRRYLEGVLKDNGHTELVNIFQPKTPTTPGLPDFHQVNVLSTLAASHPLGKFITKQQPLFMEDFVSALKSGFVDLHTMRSGSDNRTSFGVLEASQGPSHGDSAWTRDMAAVALGKFDIGQMEFAKKIAVKLYQAYAQQSQRQKINDLLGDNKNKHQNDYPHTKFEVQSIQADGKIVDYKLVDYKRGWPMKQLDAYGYVLTLLGKLACARKINIPDLDAQAKNEDSNFYCGNTESTLVALSRMLIENKYWDTGDFGAWEYPEHPKRASSIAACISGLKWVRKYFEDSGAFTDASKAPVNVTNDQGYNIQQFKTELDEGIQAGENYLFPNRIPTHEDAVRGESAKELENGGTKYDCDKLHHRDRHKDAALLFILALSDPSMIGEHGIGRAQEDSILRTVYELMGDVGFKRFLTDEYMGMNWTLALAKHKHTFYGEHADNQATNYKPAEWCLFDPYLAVFFYKRFLNSEGKDLESYLRADRHARRSLAQITKANYTFFKQGYSGGGGSIPEGEVKIPAGEVMEHYWYANKDLHTGQELEHGSWMAGENYRLNWTKIALQQMIYWGSKAGLKFKAEYPNGWDKQEITGLNLSMLGQKGKVESTRAKAAYN